MSSRAGADFARRAALAASVSLAIVLAAVVLWQAAYVLLLLFAALLIALLLDGAAGVLHRFVNIPRKIGLALVIVATLVVIVAMLWFVGPRVAQQVDQLWQSLSQSVTTFRADIGRYEWGRWFLRRGNHGEMAQAFSRLVSGLGTAVSSAIGAVFAAVVVFAAAIYLAFTPRQYLTGFLYLVPPGSRKEALRVLRALGYTLRWWLVGQLISMLLVGFVTWLGLWMLGVQLAFALGVVAFGLEFVPYFGPIIAAIPACLIALNSGPRQLVYVGLLYIGVQQLEGLLIQPIVQRKVVHLPPVLTIFSVTLFGLLFGTLGFLLATPLMAAIMIAVKMIYIQDVLGEDVFTPDEEWGEGDDVQESSTSPTRNSDCSRSDSTSEGTS